MNIVADILGSFLYGLSIVLIFSTLWAISPNLVYIGIGIGICALFLGTTVLHGG